MSTKRKLRRNLSKPPTPPNAVMVETETKFEGQKVFLLVPIHTGLDPKELALEFSKQLSGLVEIAKQPTLRDLTLMSADAIPKLISRAMSREN